MFCYQSLVVFSWVQPLGKFLSFSWCFPKPWLRVTVIESELVPNTHMFVWTIFLTITVNITTQKSWLFCWVTLCMVLCVNVDTPAGIFYFSFRIFRIVLWQLYNGRSAYGVLSDLRLFLKWPLFAILSQGHGCESTLSSLNWYLPY